MWTDKKETDKKERDSLSEEEMIIYYTYMLYQTRRSHVTRNKLYIEPLFLVVVLS